MLRGMATLPAADARAGVDGWLRLAIVLRRPRRITGLDDAATLRWVLPLIGGIWTLGIGAFVAAKLPARPPPARTASLRG